VIEKVYFVWVMEVCTDSDSDSGLVVEGLVVRNLWAVELDDFRCRYAGESGGLEEVEPFAFEVALAFPWAGDLDLIP